MAGEQTSRLTIEAAALGFEASASSVDVLAKAEARLAENQKELEAAKAGGTVGDVARLTDEQQKLSFVREELRNKTEGLSATEKDWVRTMRAIDPALGEVGERMFSALKVTGDLATKQLSLKGAFESATEVIGKNAASLALLGAGGFAAFGIDQLIGSFQRMAEEARIAEEAIRKQIDAINELARARGERAQSIEDIADARRGGGFTAEQSKAAREVAEQIGREFEALKPENIARAVGSLGDRGLSKEQLTQAAILVQTGGLKLESGASPERMQAAFEKALEKRQGTVDTFVTRETTQLIEDLKLALVEANQEGGSTAAIERFIRTQIPRDSVAGQDVGQLARILAALPGAGPEDVRLRDIPSIAISGAGEVDTEIITSALKGRGISDATPENVRTSQGILIQLQRIADRLEKTGGQTVVNNPKYYGPGAGKATNGNSRAREMESR